MTDKTDIAALMRDMRDLADRIVECQGENSDGEDVIHLYDQSDTTFKAENILLVLSAFEEQRQRADKAELELIKPLPIGELIQRLEGQTYEKWFSQSDLKGEQAPYGFIDPNAETGGMWVKIRAREGDQFTAPIFTVPQKPIINKEKLCDWLEDEFDITNGQRDALAADFAHCCDCFVSDNKAIDTNL